MGDTAPQLFSDANAVDTDQNDLATDPIPEILYVMGTGRSGTTVLEVLLTNNSGFVGVGEIKHIFRDGFLRNRPCACGKATLECPLWSSVLDATGWSRADCAKIEGIVRKLESHGRFPVLWAGLVGSRRIASYRQANEHLFKAISKVSRGQVIVDSSKYASRALALARLFPNRVMVLCITRSAAGVIKAFQRKNEGEQKPKSLLAVTAYYVYVLFCMRLVKVRLKRNCLSVRFEDMKRDPAAVISNIEEWSGYSLAPAQRKLADGDWFEIGHIVTGNRLRKKGRVRFEPGLREDGPRSITERLIGPVLEGYRKLLGF